MKAGMRGHVAIIRWLAQEAGVSAEGLNLVSFIDLWPDCTAAHSRDLLEAVQLLVGVAGCRDWKFPLCKAEYVLLYAAERGDLALVQYLQGQCERQQQGQQQEQQGQQGQFPPVAWPDGTTIVQDAVEAGCEALLEWLMERHPGSRMEDTSQGHARSMYLCAAKKADRGTLAALRRLGVPWGTEDVVVQAVKKGCEVTVLRWLVEQGAPVGRAQDMEEAVADWVGRGGLSSEAAAWLQGLVGAADAKAAAVQY